MRAPQYRRVYPKPNGSPHPAKQGLRIEPFANVFALLEGPGVISLHKTEPEAKTALLERRIEQTHVEGGS